MSKPIIGIVGNFSLINDQYPAQTCSEMNIQAVAEAADAVPVMIPSLPDYVDVAAVLDRFDGFVFGGARPNVHPTLYGETPSEAHEPYDENRDAVAFALIRESVARAKPILGLCRGFQEIAVAFGAGLHPEIRDLPGRMNHRMPPDGTLEEKFELRHAVRLIPGGAFAGIFGADEVMVNSLHGQGITRESDDVIIEGWAEDDTPEAIRVRDAPGFAMAVQWHAEWNAARDPVSRPLFAAFGAAARAA